jgi:hypothetical protein
LELFEQSYFFVLSKSTRQNVYFTPFPLAVEHVLLLLNNKEKIMHENGKSFTTGFLTDNTPQEVFKAITNVRGWWSEEIEGGTEKLNDEFRYHFKDVHSCIMKLIEVVPDQKVVWLVKDNYFNFTKDKTEWVGTKIIFEISEKDNQTQLRFTHLGLVPAYECYDVCFNAWSGYITNSLRDLVATGKGKPNLKEE